MTTTNTTPSPLPLTEDELFEIFSRDARYMKDSPKNKYQIRYKGKFMCAPDTETLFSKMKSFEGIS